MSFSLVSTEREMFVQTEKGEKVCVIVCPTDSVRNIKEKLEPLINIKQNWQQIYLQHQNLDDQTQISDLGEQVFQNVLRVVRGK